MTREAIRERIRELARSELEDDEPVADEDLVAQLDSVQFTTVLVAVEDDFRIRIGEEDELAMRSFEDLVTLVAERHDG